MLLQEDGTANLQHVVEGGASKAWSHKCVWKVHRPSPPEPASSRPQQSEGVIPQAASGQQVGVFAGSTVMTYVDMTFDMLCTKLTVFFQKFRT